MTIDKYALCPGGTGKKIKFCCPDLTHEIEKIDRLRDADQPQGCLELLERLEKKYPERLCLCTIKAEVLRDLGRPDDAQQVLAGILERDNDNPTALAESALVLLETTDNVDDVLTAIHRLQSALDSAADQWPEVFFELFLQIGLRALDFGLVLASVGHLLVLNGAVEDSRVGMVLRSLFSSPQLPRPYKEDRRFQTAPADAPWKPEFDAASSLAARVHWQAAAEKLAELATRVDHPAIWNNLGILRGWLGDHPGAVEAWTRYSACDVPYPDKVVAEELIGVIQQRHFAPMVDRVGVTYPIHDWDRAIERLISDSRIAVSDPSSLPLSEGESRPRNSYLLLDRDKRSPTSATKIEELARFMGTAHLYGRETDREPRLVLVIWSDNREQCELILREILGDALGEPGEVEVYEPQAGMESAFRTDYYFRKFEEQESIRGWLAEHLQRVLCEVWLNRPIAWLDGKTPSDIAGDPQWQPRLEAAVVQLESLFDDVERFETGREITRPVRERLGLATTIDFDPESQSIDSLRLYQLKWLAPQKLDDKSLSALYIKASGNRVGPAVYALGREMLTREALNEDGTFAYVHAQMAEVVFGSQESVEHFRQARQTLLALGRSPGTFLARELINLVTSGRTEEFVALATEMNKHYAGDPEVRQALVQVMEAVQEISPSGGAGAQSPPGLAEAGQSAEPAGIWTPDSQPAQPSQPSKLWIPD